MSDLARQLAAMLPSAYVFRNEPMSRRTTFRIGGDADWFVTPATVGQIRALVALTREQGVPLTVLGNGSNVLVADAGIRGVVMSIGQPLAYISADADDATVVRVGAGTILGRVSLWARDHGLAGLEFACGIPGSVGGAVVMNAGAYDGEMSGVIASVTALTATGELTAYDRDALDLSYRHSRFQDGDDIITGITLRLTRGDVAEIAAKMADFTARRQAKQPLEFPSAGSTFRRPPGNFAGTLIDRAGLKGFRIGGAEVSAKHAGFIVNVGNATSADVRALIAEVQRRVRTRFGVDLHPEIKIIGGDAQ